MGCVLDKRYTKNDSTTDILRAIRKLSRDKLNRICLEDQNEWLERKLKEIDRLTGLLLPRYLSPKDAASARD